MPDSIPNDSVENLALPDSAASANHSRGGPSTPEGKSRSSRNAVKHGCRSHIVILPGENQHDFNDLYDRWMAAYQPEDDAQLELVEQLILSKWFLLRNERRYSEVEQDLAATAFADWEDAHHKKFQLALRYKTAAERSVTRAMRELESYMSRSRRDERAAHQAQMKALERQHKLEGDQTKMAGILDTLEKKFKVDLSAQKAILNPMSKISAPALPQTPAQKLFRGKQSPKNLPKMKILDQWIEITVEDGKTVTTLYPPNATLIEEGKVMEPPPEMVYRRLNFPSGVPDEYDWTTDDPEIRMYGGVAIQRMSVDTWLDAIKEEAKRTDGHIGMLKVPPLPRPLSRGRCACDVCAAGYERLERAAADALLQELPEPELPDPELPEPEPLPPPPTAI